MPTPPTAPGWTDPLLLFAMDHRNSYRQLLGIGPDAPAADHDRAREVKAVVFDGFAAALDRLDDARGAALLVDEEYGSALAARAHAAGALVCVPVERSGRAELDLEHGAGLPGLVERMDADLVKVLLRYNAASDRELNRRQGDGVARLSGWCREQRVPLVLEVLVPPTEQQRGEGAADPDRWSREWDGERRPALTVTAVDELRAAGADPDVWKVEGLDDPAPAEAIVRAARAGGRDAVGCVVLGRGASLDRVDEWLRVGAAVDGFVGFAVGRSLWNAEAAALWSGSMDADEVRRQVAGHYLRVCATWQQVRAAA